LEQQELAVYFLGLLGMLVELLVRWQGQRLVFSPLFNNGKQRRALSRLLLLGRGFLRVELALRQRALCRHANRPAILRNRSLILLLFTLALWGPHIFGVHVFFGLIVALKQISNAVMLIPMLARVVIVFLSFLPFN
jgi:hypothetical protein